MWLIPLLLTLAGYALMSLLLFCFPTILHKKMRYRQSLFNQAVNGERVLRIAHRGGPRHGTENTIETFKKALPFSDVIQTDVCETKDGILVVHHDHDLLRTCGVHGFIRDYNLADLPSFLPKIELNFAPEGLTSTTNKEKIPTLEQVFETFPETVFNIEIKTPSKRAVQELVRLMGKYQRRDRTVVGIRGAMQDELRDEDINTLRFVNDKQFAWLLVFYVTGLLPYLYIEEATLQLPLFTTEFYQWKLRQWGSKWSTHAFFWIIRALNLILRPLVSHFKKRGIMTYYWVCNGKEEYGRALRCGACGIMTDDPPLLDSFLKNTQENGISSKEE